MTKFKIEGLTVAITNMTQMVDFYKAVFQVEFKPQEMYGATLYSGQWIGLNLLFCPREIAQNSAEQNRHQFDIIVPDIDEAVNKVLAYSGEMMSEVAVQENHKVASIKDPDGNSIVLKENL